MQARAVFFVALASICFAAFAPRAAALLRWSHKDGVNG